MSRREILAHLLALGLLLVAAGGFYAYQKSAAMVPTLIAYLDSPKKPEVRAALGRLQELGPAASAAAPRLLSMVRAGGADAEGAIAALSRIDLAAALTARDHLRAALRDGDTNTRRRAAERLGNLGLLARAVSGDLALAAHDPDAVLRDRAVASLGRIGVPAGIVVPALIAALDDPADHVRHAAVIALESLPADQARAALPALRRLAERGGGLDKRARHVVSRLDGALSQAGDLGALRYMLGGGKRFGSLDFTLQQVALHGPGAASLVPELLALLTGDDELMRYAVIETLIAIGPGAATARPALEGIAATGTTPLRQVAQEALAALAGASR